MLTREQYVAHCDQELARVRDKLSRLVDRYAENMDHVAECSQCDEVDNVAQLASALVEEPEAVGYQSLAVTFAVAIKTIYELRKRLTE